MSATPGPSDIDIRRDPLARVAALDIREAGRSFADDEAAIWDRLEAAWAGLDDRAWRHPGASKSDGGGADWSFFDHVAHVAAWHRDAPETIERVLAGGSWPTLAEQNAVDYDGLNEEARPILARMTPAELRAAFRGWRERLLRLVLALPRETMQNEEAWEFTYFALFGHVVDHLAPLEPWADELRRRIEANDHFGEDVRAGSGNPAVDRETFFHDEAQTFAAFETLIGRIPPERRRELRVGTGGWSVHDHVGHVAAWFEEAARIVDAHVRDGGWPSDWESGIDDWNARQIEAWRELPGAEVSMRLATGRQRLRSLSVALPDADLRSESGWGWTYHCLHGHVRQHAAAVATACMHAGWPGGAAARAASAGERG